jgi:hypothetical protein
MTPDNVRQALITIQNRLQSVLDQSASRVLADAAAQMVVTTTTKKKNREVAWILTISRESPLRFRQSTAHGLRVQADLSCRLAWDQGIKSQDVLLRLWSQDEHICFRNEFDAAAIRDRLPTPPSRVIARYHFDKANAGQDGPVFHLQYGGNPADEELFWHPESFAWPRILHHPVDLVLACEMVAANLFATEYRQIAKDPTWLAAIRNSQTHFVDAYFGRCRQALTNGASLMASLWNKNDLLPA